MFIRYITLQTEGPTGTFYTLDTHPNIPEDATEEQLEQLQNQENEVAYLGKVDDHHYTYVPDGYPLKKQAEEIQAISLESLDPEVHKELLLNGDFAINSRYDLAYPKQAYHPEGYGSLQYGKDFATLYSAIAELSDIIGSILDKGYMTLDEKSTDKVILTNFNELRKQAKEIKNKLSKVNL